MYEGEITWKQSIPVDQNTNHQKQNSEEIEASLKLLTEETLQGKNESTFSWKDEKEEDLQKKKEYAQILRKRFALKDLIQKGDQYLASNQPILALSEYLKALKENPNDVLLIKKIATTYFYLKKFESSLYHFENILDTFTNEDDYTYYIYSLLYTMDLNDSEHILNTMKKISNLPISKEKKFFYVNSTYCIINFHECKKMFWEFFKEHKTPTFKWLQDVQTALNQYENFWYDKKYFKNTLLIIALFENGMFPISSRLWERILFEKKDYLPMLLVVWKWYYELGNTKKAKYFLEAYYKKNPYDINVSFLLGMIHYKLGDYVASNMYYHVTIKNFEKTDYTTFLQKDEIYRKLIYNYYLLWDKKGMFHMFSYLLVNKNATVDDFALWIYLAITEQKWNHAKIWAEKALAQTEGKPGYEIFYGYLAWIYRELDDLESATQYIQKGLAINRNNPLLTLNRGILDLKKWNIVWARVYLRKTIFLNGDGEFGTIASKMLEDLELQESSKQAFIYWKDL